jgi:hypothetical protein
LAEARLACRPPEYRVLAERDAPLICRATTPTLNAAASHGQATGLNRPSAHRITWR